MSIIKRKIKSLFKQSKNRFWTNKIENSTLLTDAKINKSDYIIKNGNYLITEQKNKLNLLAAQFAQTNNKKRGSNSKEGLNRIIHNTIKKFIRDNNIDTNTSLEPFFEKDPSFFCNPKILGKFINRLKNKKIIWK